LDGVVGFCKNRRNPVPILTKEYIGHRTWWISGRKQYILPLLLCLDRFEIAAKYTTDIRELQICTLWHTQQLPQPGLEGQQSLPTLYPSCLFTTRDLKVVKELVGMNGGRTNGQHQCKQNGGTRLQYQ